MSKKTYLLIGLCLSAFSTAYAQGNLDKALNNAYEKSRAESKAKFDAKMAQAIDYAVSKNKSGITQIRPIESNPDAYILKIDGTSYMFTRPDDRDNAKNRFINNATKDAIAKLVAIQGGNDNMRQRYEKGYGAEVRQKISNRCSVSKGRNPNYRAKPASEYILPTTPHSTVNDADSDMPFIIEASTQYDNIFDAPSARGTNAPVKSNAETISVSFEDIGNYLEPKINPNKPFLNPVQKARELEKSKRAYEIAYDKIANYEKDKENIEKEINNLTVSGENIQERIAELRKDSAKLYYQETVVWYEATNHGTEAEKAVVVKAENDLKNIYGLSDAEIKRLKAEPIEHLKKGVPTLNLLEDIDEDAELSTVKIGTPLAAGMFESVYSSTKKRISKDIQKHNELYKSNTNRLNSKQQQLTDMTTERNNLQKVFNKYGYDIVNNQDDYQIINFGNECRDVLSIKIE